MSIALVFFLFIFLLFGGFYGLWKFDTWSQPLTTRVIYLDGYSQMEMIYKIRNKMIILLLVFVWIFTFISGMFGIWKNITTPLLISITGCFTISCIYSIIKRRYCNAFLGSGIVYFGYLCLLATFKIGYWQFAISYWWFVGLIALNTAVSLLILWQFLKNGKKISTSNNKKMLSFSAIGLALMSYPIISAVGHFLRVSSVGNEVTVPIIMALLTLFAFSTTLGIRYLVLDDSRILSKMEFIISDNNR